MSENEILIAISFGSMHAKLYALKKSLNKEQLEIYTKSMLDWKNKFIDNHPKLSDEALQALEKAVL